MQFDCTAHKKKCHHTQEGENENHHLVALTDYALAMKERLTEVNRHSFNNFKLRVG